MAKEAWGVHGYESMKGLIRLCVDAREATGEEECGSGESDKEHAK